MPAIPDSILDTTKKALGLDADYTAFDVEVIMHINSVFSTLQQLGAGPDDGFMIEDRNRLWVEYLGLNSKHLNLVKSYVFLKVKLLFDIASTTSFVIAAMEKQTAEMEWRITVAAESGELIPIPPNPDWEQQIQDFLERYLAEHPMADGYVHTQTIPLSQWTIPHALGREPVVAVYIGDELVLADIDATDSLVTIQFPTPAVGIAVLT